MLRQLLIASMLAATVAADDKTSAFYVCGSSVPALNGLYETDGVTTADDAPVFTRADDGDDDDDVDNDFRVFRHGGFWAVADYAPWPPEVHFRCDPAYDDDDGGHCKRYAPLPPNRGYSARVPDDTTKVSPTLQLLPCRQALAGSKEEL